jgi:hypothetical protein
VPIVALAIALGTMLTPSSHSAQDAAAAGGAAVGVHSPYALQQEYARASGEIERLSRQAETLRSIQSEAQGTRERLTGITLDDAAATRALTEWKKEAAAGKLAAGLGSRSPGQAQMQAALGPIMQALSDLWSRRPEDEHEARMLFDTGPWSQPDPLFELMYSPNPDPQRIAALSLADMKMAFEGQKSAGLSRVDRLLSSVTALLTDRQGAIKRKQDELTRLDTQLSSAGEQRSVIDRLLIYAIWFMIGCLMLLFLSLRIFPLSVQTALIDNRVLVEVVSMAFMLLTIIILATGNKLQTEALGTLLGTIAGYIFGRRMDSVLSRPRPDPERRGLPASSEPLPSPDAGT